MRLAFADRALWTGDTDKNADLPVRGLIDDNYLRYRATRARTTIRTTRSTASQAGARLSEIRPGDPRPFQVAPAMCR